MGVTQVTVVIRNPAEPDRTWEGLFLVDTGAIDSLVPRPHLEAIGLKPKGQRVYGLADGSEVRLDITTGDIEFMGEIAEPLLGVTALRSVGIEVDPRNQTLKRLPRTRLWSAEVYVRVLRTRIHRVLTLAMRRRRERICIRHLIF